MSWDDLRFVLELARADGVTEAARRLGVVPSTVYRRIQAIERRDDVTLFERRGARYDLTPAGEAYVAAAREVEGRVEELSRRLARQEPDVEGQVHITAVSAMAERLAEPLAALRRQHPHLRIRLSATTEMVSLARGEADIAIRVTQAPPERLVGRKVADVRFAIYGARAVHLPGTDLDRCPWVCLDESLARTPQGLWEAARVAPDRVALSTNDRPLFVRAVAAGIGVGVLPMGIGEPDPELVAHSEPIAELALPVWVLTHDGLREAPRVRAAMDLLVRVLADARDDF